MSSIASSISVTSALSESSMMSSITKTLEFGSVVIIRRMSLVRGGDDLHLEVGQAADLVDQEQVRRLGDGHRQHAADHEQRQHEVLLDVLPRQDVDDLRVEQPGVELGVGHAVFGGQALDHLVLGAVVPLDEDLAQQLVPPLLLLLLQRRLQVVGREIALVDQQVAEASGSEGGGVHGRVVSCRKLFTASIDAVEHLQLLVQAGDFQNLAVGRVGGGDLGFAALVAKLVLHVRAAPSAPLSSSLGGVQVEHHAAAAPAWACRPRSRRHWSAPSSSGVWTTITSPKISVGRFMVGQCSGQLVVNGKASLAELQLAAARFGSRIAVHPLQQLARD